MGNLISIGATFGFIVGIATQYIVTNYLLETPEKQENLRLNFVRSGNEHVNFLSDMISRLWGNLRVAINQKIRESIEPLLNDMKIPLKLEKVDMGSNPIRLENIIVHELKDNGSYFQFNMDVVWKGRCNIKFVRPSFGIANITFDGRMQFIVKPLSNELPCIGAVQYAFIDPPKIKMDFTGIAALANSKLITD